MTTPDLATDNPLILLVDDEPNILAAFTLLLEAEGYRVKTARDGRDGLARLREMRPDLIITDYMMPYVDGLELIRAVRADPGLAGISTLLMSAALPSRVNSDDAADAFLPKMTGLDRILEVIGKLIDKARKD